jgi:hypothetical protein
MPEIVCPSCRKKLRPPARLAGRRVTCPRCDEVLTVPVEASDSDENLFAAVETTPSIEEEPLPLSARLGMGALVLGLASILMLCLPFIGGYASLGLSGMGLLVALSGLVQARTDGSGTLSQSVSGGGVGIWGGFGTRARDYPLAGVGACLFALFLALLPSLFH